MSKRIVLILASAACLAAPSVFAQAAAPAAARTAAKAGLWEVKIDETGPTMGRTVTTRVCLTAAEAAEGTRLVPRQLVPGGRCENRDLALRGAEATWKAACSGEATRSGAGKVSIADSTFSGSGELDAKVKGKTEKLKQTYAGKWIGPCK